MTTETTQTFAEGISMHHATRAKAAKLQTTLMAEYPRLTLVARPDENDTLRDFEIIYAMGTEEAQVILTTEKVPSLALVLDTVSEEGLDPTLPEEEEAPRASGSVVPEAYRSRYRAESSTGRCNGDWLAEQLAADTLDHEGKLNLEDFVAVLERNGVDMSGKWAQLHFTGARGWQGRFRMNGRQILEKMVAKTGQYFGSVGDAMTPSEDFLADMRTKHAKWLAKEAKREAAATEAIKSTVEG